MSADIRAGLELDRLAEVLGCTADEVAGAGDLAPDDLAHLRRQLAAGLVAQHTPIFDRFAAASALVPAALAAKITQRAIGPALAGRMAGSMSATRSAAVMSHLPTPFLADCCRTLSPVAAARLVPSIPDDAIVATTTELIRRQDHDTLGRFVDAVDDRRLRLVLDLLREPADLLLAGAATDHGAALDRVIALLSPDRRASIIAASPGHPREALSILVRIGADARALLATAVAEQDDDTAVAILDGLTEVVTTLPAARSWATSLPTPEVAAAARLFDRSDVMRSAVGRLGMAVLTDGGEQ